MEHIADRRRRVRAQPEVNPTSGDLFLQTDTAGGWIWNATKSLWQQVLTGLPTSVFNDGGSWLPGTGVYALDSAPSNSSIVYLAFLSEVLVSTNKCASWTSTAFSSGTGIFAANTAYDTVSPKLAIDPANPNIVFIGTYQNGVWFTLNGGTSWTQISSSQIPLSATEPSEGGYPGYTILFDPSSAVSGGATQGITSRATATASIIPPTAARRGPWCRVHRPASPLQKSLRPGSTIA